MNQPGGSIAHALYGLVDVGKYLYEAVAAASDTDSDDDEYDHVMEAAILAATERRTEYTTYEELNLFAATFNVNGQDPPPEGGPDGGLAPWLYPDTDMPPPHLYVIGFQELDLSQQAHVYHFFTPSDALCDKQMKWLPAVERALHPGAEYVQLQSTRMVGVSLTLYIRKDFLEQEEKPVVLGYCIVPTGIMGYMGNKGAVAVHIKLRDTTICFVCSHLAAHFVEYPKRNADFHTIQNYIAFNDFVEVGPPLIEKVPEIPLYEFPATFYDHDMIFWLGDMNYRLETDTGEQADADDVLRLLRSKNAGKSENLQKLAKYDQLCRAQTSAHAFVNYTEFGKFPSFPPTYKYKVGTDEFEIGDSSRVPAWTDRILYRGDTRLVDLLDYGSAPSVRISDHKPVYAVYGIKIGTEDVAKKDVIIKEHHRRVSTEDVDHIIDVSIDKLSIDFGGMAYADVITRSLELRNNGLFKASFHFESERGGVPFPLWLEICPSSGAIAPDATETIQLRCKLDSGKSVYDFHRKTSSTSHFDVKSGIRCVIKQSHDYPVTLTGQYRYTCFGRPISGLPSVGETKLCPPFLGDIPSGVPLPLARLLHHIEQDGLARKIFCNSLLTTEFAALRDLLCKDCCGTGSSIPEKLPVNINTVAIGTLAFLESMHEPLIPFELYPSVRENLLDESPGSLSLFLNEELPMRNLDTLKYLVGFFHKLLKKSEKNKVTVELLGMMFGPPIFRPKPVCHVEQARRKSSVVVRTFSTETASIAAIAQEQASTASKFVNFLIQDWK